MVPLMKSTASSNWDKALCYKPDFRQAMLWFHFDFQTLIYLISFFSVWTWSRQSASTEDVPKKKKKNGTRAACLNTALETRWKTVCSALFLETTPALEHTRAHSCTHLHRYVCVHTSMQCARAQSTRACMHACMQEGIHLHTMLKIQLSPTPVSVALAACVCVIRL